MVRGVLTLGDADQVEGAHPDENSVFVRNRVADESVGANFGGVDFHVDNASTYSISSMFTFEETFTPRSFSSILGRVRPK